MGSKCGFQAGKKDRQPLENNLLLALKMDPLERWVGTAGRLQ